VLLAGAVIGLDGVVELLESNGPLHIFIEDQDESRNLPATQLKVEVDEHLFEFVSRNRLRVSVITSSVERLRSQTLLGKTLLELLECKLFVADIGLFFVLPCKLSLLLLNILLDPPDGELLPELGLNPGHHLLDVDHLHEVLRILGASVGPDFVDGLELHDTLGKCLLHVSAHLTFTGSLE